MITYRFRFVKNFFKSFSTFFVPSFAAFSIVICRPRSRPDYLTTAASRCQALFSSFPNFFQRSTRPAFVVLCSPRQSPAAERLLILAKGFPLVNTFFQKNRLFYPQLFPQLYLPVSPAFHYNMCPFTPFGSFYPRKAGKSPCGTPVHMVP